MNKVQIAHVDGFQNVSHIFAKENSPISYIMHCSANIINDINYYLLLFYYIYYINYIMSLFRLENIMWVVKMLISWFNATLNNITIISWRSVLLVEETGVSRENHWPVASHLQTLSHNFVSSTPRLSGVRTHNVSGDRHWLDSSIKCWYMTSNFKLYQ